MPESQQDTTIVIFGASGDLTRSKLIPALYRLFQQQKLPANFKIVGFARRPYSHDDFKNEVLGGARGVLKDAYNDADWQHFTDMMWYSRGDLATPADYVTLESFLGEIGAGAGNRLYYLATAPEYYVPVVENLAAINATDETNGWRRIVVEKPFGTNLATATELNTRLHAAFQEQQVYRIDHYLGKETVQNILFFRFANAIFEPVWNRTYIDHVQITVSESVDIENRAGYYEHAGILRDMFQNHMLQLLCLVAMEPPLSFNGESLRLEKSKVLRALRPAIMGNTVRAQYEDYTSAPGVKPDSTTPTFGAVKLFIDNWRWQDVPFYMRSGKALERKSSEITVQFRRPPHLLFDLPKGKRLKPNILALCIQPDEGIHLRFETKVPNANDVQSVDMEFRYGSSFKNITLPDAYERLLLDALNGDNSLFISDREISLSWKFIDTIIDGWANDHAPPLVKYKRGSWGPTESDLLMEDDGRVWRMRCGQEPPV